MSQRRPDLRARFVAWIGEHRRGVLAAVMASAATLVGIAAILAWVTFTNPPPIAEATPSGGPSSGPPATAEPNPTATPGESGFSSKEGFLQVAIDGLRLRVAASTSADVVRVLERGEVVKVVSGPVDADGYHWYEVLGLDNQRGWAASGDGEAFWLEVVPPEPVVSTLLIRFDAFCDAGKPPLILPNVTVMADGRTIRTPSPYTVRTLSPSGIAQLQREVLDLALLQTSASYVPERLPNTPDPPGHGACLFTFTLGEAPERVVTCSGCWFGEAEEEEFYVPSPERRALNEAATKLSGMEAWLGADAWAEPTANAYVGHSYLLTLTAGEVVGPSVSGAAWPFDGPIEEFGCGYLSLAQTFETLRLMGERGVPLNDAYGRAAAPLSTYLGGSIGTDAGGFLFLLTARTPDGYPSCAS